MGGTVREIDVVEQSHRDYLRSVICIIVCLSWAVNHYRDNVITYKPSATKQSQRTGWRTRQLSTCRCVSVMLALDAKYTKELADAKAENDALRGMMLPLVVVGCTSAVCQSVREATTASGVDNAAPRLADTAERDYFTLRERLITTKTTGRNPEVY